MKTQDFRRGAWTPEEDSLLRRCIEVYGEGKWNLVAERAGLNRCRKSCRLRWINYLDPNVNRKEFEEDEIDLILRMHKLLGNKWSLIAGRIPGRTANDIKNYFNTHLRKTLESQPKEKEEKPKSTRRRHQVIRPVPRYPSTLIATGGPLIVSGNQQQHLHREQPSQAAASPPPEEQNEEPVIQNNEHTIWWDSAFKLPELEGVEYMNQSQNPMDITSAGESSYAGTRIDGNETTVCHDSTLEWCHLLEHHLLDGA